MMPRLSAGALCVCGSDHMRRPAMCQRVAFGWDVGPRPPTSDEFVAAQARYYPHAIDAFGPERCMFESDFPVDRVSVSSRVMWNALQKIVAGYSDDEQNEVFSGTARRVYRL